MKINFTRGLLAALAIVFASSLVAQPNWTYIWGGPNSTGSEYDNSTFNGGMNDWTTQGLECKVQDSVANAVWVWNPDGILVPKGAYWLDARALASPTASNGTVGFNSDYLDNFGMQDSFGIGPAPAPQKSVLTSPSIDCSGEPDVAVFFYQSYRNFEATPYIEVSNDGGNSWDRYEIYANQNIGLNEWSGADSWRYVVISPTAGNQPDVRIRFVWDGYYYFWIIDDVALVRPPALDVAVFDYIVPASSFAQPQLTGVDCDIMGFRCRVRNMAYNTVNNVTVKAEVLDEDSTVLFSTDTLIAEFRDTVSNDTIDFSETWAPVNEQGVYTVRYTISADSSNGEEFYSEDNSLEGIYVVTDRTFAKWHSYGFHPYPLIAPTSFLALGSYYNVCEPNTDGLEVAIDTVLFEVAPVVGFPPNQTLERTIELHIKKVIDPTKRYPNNGQLTSSLLENDGPDKGWEFVSYSEYTLTDPVDVTEVAITDFLNVDGDPTEAKLDANHEYLLIFNTTANGNSLGLSIAYSDDAPFYIGGGLIVRDGHVAAYWGGSPGDAPNFIIKLKILVDTKLPKLADNVLEIMPNPVTNGRLRFKMDFDNPTDVAYAVATMHGSLISTGHVDGVRQQVETVDVSHLAAGEYLLRIQTKDGVATKSFVVVK